MSSTSSSQQSNKTLLGQKYMIGEELGRGAYGQVFKGMDTSTGDVVAIKQIGLGGVSQANLQGVMGEIDLLKTLNHNNIVKYIGSFKSRNHLYIILEFMENGALSSVIKPTRFGVFPETLVAIYIAQVLQGLAYLHDQGVVHRDIKGANILTTKDGLVKLADFGVAAKLGELEEQHCDELHQNVVGTPYWMAPEVIEMTQVTPASDIWSVGCLIIELLTGYPPYYDLQPMSALFRIVQDPHPPLPETISPLLEDFLLKCFQKDPSARPDARGLLQHEWVQFNRRTLRGTWSKTQGFKSRAAGGPKASDAHESVNSVIARILHAEGSEEDVGASRSSFEAQQAAAAASRGMDTAATAVSNSSAARLQQPQVVRTIDASVGPLASDTPPRLALQQDTLLTASSLSGAGMQAAAAGGSGSGPLPAMDSLTERQGRRYAGSIELAAQQGHPNGSASPVPSPRSRFGQQQQQQGAVLQHQQQHPYQQQQQPYRLQQQQELQAAGQQQQQQDYHLQQSSVAELGPPAGSRPPPLIYQGEQLQYGPGTSGRGSPTRQQMMGPSPVGLEMDSPLGNLLARIQGDQYAIPGVPGGVPLTPSAAAAAGLSGPVGSQNLMAWLEDGPAAGARAISSFNGLAGNSRNQLMDGGLFGGLGLGGNSYLLHVPSNNSLESMQSQGMENESSYLLEVKRKVRDLVRGLRPVPNASPQQSAASQASAACALAGLFNRQPETRQLFLAEGGVLAALELLDADLARVAEAGLEVLRAFTASDTRLLESLCLVGLVPVIVRMAAAGGAVSGSGSSWQALGSGSSYTSVAISSGSSALGKDGPGAGAAGAAAGGSLAAAAIGAMALGGPAVHSGSSAEVTHLRKKAAGFVVQLCFAKETTLQMFIACGGLRCLVVMVQDNLQDCNTLTPVAVACIWQVLETYGALPINYICHIFAAAGLIPRLFAVIKQLISLNRQQQQQQQQQQRSIGNFQGPAGAQGPGLPKLQHLNCPLTPQGLPFATADFFPLGSLGPGGRDAPQAAADGSSDAAGPVSVPMGSKTLGKTMLGGRKGSPVVEAGLAGTDELQQQQHRRALSVDDRSSAAAAAAAGASTAAQQQQQQQQQQGQQQQQQQQQTRAEWLQEKCLDLLLVLAHADSVVKGLMCSKDNLQHLLDLTQKLRPPGLIKAMKTIRWLTSEASVLPDMKNSGAIGQLVPFLSRECEAVHGQAVVLEALQALYNICFFHKRVHLEVAASSGIVPHLCRFASEHVAAAAAAAAAGSNDPAAGPNSALPAVGDPLAQPGALSAAAAADTRRMAVRTYVVPLLIGLATTSSSTRAKLWASNGLDIFLQLLGTEDAQMQVGLMRTLDIWLSEDHSRVENRLCQREAVGQLVEVYNRLCRNASSVRSPVMPQMLDSLKVMLDRSSKVAVALAAGGLVPPLLEPLMVAVSGRNAAAASSAPILRAKLLDIISIMYQHHPRPKEFIMKYRIQDVLLRLLESEGRGEDAVKVEAQKLLNAFHINVLL